eukprot:gb/GFBE01035646.1/.p1 GENE.gb/GFBE01035646.1/~~gb/GFBE01035646.1/.p1  ORF type:complete len:192 (+),score=28.47 gb/GFBE01035646.1/:1-576(+)
MPSGADAPRFAALGISGLLDELEADFSPRPKRAQQATSPGAGVAGSSKVDASAQRERVGAIDTLGADPDCPLSKLLGELQRDMEEGTDIQADSHQDAPGDVSCLSLDDWLRIEGVGLRAPGTNAAEHSRPHRLGDRLVIEGVGLRPSEGSWWDRLVGTEEDAAPGSHSCSTLVPGSCASTLSSQSGTSYLE